MLSSSVSGSRRGLCRPLFAERGWQKMTSSENRINPIWRHENLSCKVCCTYARAQTRTSSVSAGDQRKSLEAYWKIFGGVTDYSVIAANTIDVLTQRLEFHR